MVSLLRPFLMIAKGMRAFFKADLRLQRGRRGLEVVLREEPAAPARRNRKQRQLDAAAQKEKAELQRMRQSLSRLLDEMPENRAAMRHLAFLEHAFDRKGLRALQKLPYEVLRRALEQLDGLVVNWSDAGLADLRSKMAVTLIEREQEAEGDDDDRGHARHAEGPLSSILDAGPLALPEPVDDAAEAEAALRAAYGDIALPDLQFSTAEDPAVELQGELSSPSGQALARAVRRNGTDG